MNTESETIQVEKIVINEEEASFGGPRPPAPPEGANVTTGSEKSWYRVIRWLIYGLVFLTPLLFTTWTYEPLEFSKQMLLFVLTSAAVIAWLLKLLVLRSWRFIKTPLDMPILALVVVYLLASIFSVDRHASFLGFYGSFSGNFFQIIFLVLLYYLVVNNFRSLGELKKLFGVFHLSVCVAIVFALLQFLGAYILPIGMTKVTSFNTVGGLMTLSVFSVFAIMLSLMFGEKTWFKLGGYAWRILAVAGAVVILLTVNFIYAWVALLVGLLVYIAFYMAVSDRTLVLKEFLAPLVLLVLVVALLVVQLVFPFVSIRNIFSFDLPLEVRLDYKTAMPVLTGIIKDRPVLGSGPNTFLYAFSKYRDQSFNLSPFWNMSFDKAPSEAAEYLVGSGIVGFLAFEILSVIFILFGLYFILRQKNGPNLKTAIGLFATFVTLWVLHWFFFFNTIIALAYWVSIAGFVATAHVTGAEKTKLINLSFASSPRKTISMVSAVSFSLVLVIIFLVFTASVYAADVYYHRGLVKSSKTETQEQAQNDFEQAIRLNRFRPDYYLTYGEYLFLRINQELTKKDPNLPLIQQMIAASINTSRSAVDLSPANWTAWERLANLYTSARPLVAGVDKFIIESLERATQSDPNNPILYVELGQIQRLAARRIDPAILGTGADTDSDGLSDQQEAVLGSDPADPDTNGNNLLDGNETLAGLSPVGTGTLPASFLQRYLKTNPENLLKAQQAFRKAVELKPDYASAYYNLALTLEQSGKLDEAIVEMEKALEKFPSDSVIKFELGRMYFNSGKMNEAGKQFQEILTAIPSHANARYSLALVFERQGKLQRALDEMKKVAESNPDNAELKQKIQSLEATIKASPAK